ncbi:MAG TPA: hypothetical protein VGQ89_04270 [Candidatus Limnocylindrales bacterium]|nr:hypothetical protein [Candidatus Limnocylindrales bacterium]
MAGVAIALLIAIIKPWGPGTGEPMPSPYASPTISPSAAQASEGRPFELRAELFGPFEPTPEWSIWPAGYFVSVTYVARAPRSDAEASSAPPSGGSNASPSSALPVPSPSSPPGADWPATIEIGPDDHLLWLGINTPRGWSLDQAVLRRTGADGSSTVVATRRVATPWPDHFSAIALAAPGEKGHLAVWLAGLYRLELSVSPGEVQRTLEIRIKTKPAAGPTDHVTASPS